MFDTKKVQIEWGGKTLTLETGRIARQADGAVLATLGETVVLCAVTAAKSVKEGQDFFPLTVHYQEKFSSAGRIPGGFFKRERGATEKETLTSRLIDRPVRPLFPAGWAFETQIIAMVVSADTDYDSDVLAVTGAGCALALSEMPFQKTIAGVRVGFVDGAYVINPTFAQRKASSLDLIIAGSADAVMMVEAGAQEVPEEQMVGALDAGHHVFRVNAAFEAAATSPELRGRLRYEDGPFVSVDVIGDPASCVFDSSLTQAAGSFVKVFGWYDNEWGYTARLVELTRLVGTLATTPSGP